MPNISSQYSTGGEITRFLDEYSINYALNQDRYIAMQAVPISRTNVLTGTYKVSNKLDKYRNSLQVRPRGVPPATSSSSFIDRTFRIARRSHGSPVDWDDLQLSASGNYADVLTAAMNENLAAYLIDTENRFVDTYFAANAFDTTQNVNFTNDTTLPNTIETVMDTVSRVGGQGRPNTMIMNRSAWTAFKTNDSFLDAIQGGATTAAPAVARLDLLREVFGLDNVYIAEGLRSTSPPVAEDTTTDAGTLTSILGPTVLLAYNQPAGSLGDAPTAMRGYVWNGGGEGGPVNERGFRTRQYNDPNTTSYQVDIDSYIEFEIVDSSLGALLTTVLTT